MERRKESVSRLACQARSEKTPKYGVVGPKQRSIRGYLCIMSRESKSAGLAFPQTRSHAFRTASKKKGRERESRGLGEEQDLMPSRLLFATLGSVHRLWQRMLRQEVQQPRPPTRSAPIQAVEGDARCGARRKRPGFEGQRGSERKKRRETTRGTFSPPKRGKASARSPPR